MTDKHKTVKPPPTGDDFDGTKRNTNTTSSTAPKIADRDGPAKGNTKKPMQKPQTSTKAKSSIPDAKTMASMKKSLAGIGGFRR